MLQHFIVSYFKHLQTLRICCWDVFWKTFFIHVFFILFLFYFVTRESLKPGILYFLQNKNVNYTMYFNVSYE